MNALNKIIMLNETQIKSYHENGFLILENAFDKEEIVSLSNRIPKFKDDSSPNIIREENGDIRSIFAPELQDELYGNLYKDERILIPTQQLIKDDVYLYQYKLNLKKAFSGKFWEWHQDFPYWHHGDGVARPDMISVMLLLDDVKSYQGPLLFIPKSHQHGIVDFNKKEHLLNQKENLLNSLNSDLKYTVRNDFILEEAKKNGIVSSEGKGGSIIFFHPNVFHGSNMNISPYNRNTAIITYNSIHNTPVKLSATPRPDYICYTNYEAIKTYSLVKFN